MDWCYLGPRATSSGILLVLDRRVMEKIVWGNLLLLVPFEM